MINENFDAFYDEYQRFSAYVAFCMIGDTELSKDISQEVFMSLYKVRDSLDYSSSRKLRKLVTKVTTNKCIDYMRKASTKHEFCRFSIENENELVDEKNNPESIVLRMEEEKYQTLVLERFHQRNPINYDILIKTKLLDMKAEQVAKEYGITANNVNNRNLRSKAWIIEEMEKLRRQPSDK